MSRATRPWLIALMIAGCVPPQLAGVIDRDDGLSKKSDTVRTGIDTSEEAENEGDLGPYGFRVRWIGWDSSFRDTDLRIGDRIVGVDDDRYHRSDRSRLSADAIGGWNEARYWERRGRGDGDRITLHVWRRGKTLAIQGALRADRFYYTHDKRTAMGPGGPDRLVSDGFRGAWAGWYEARVRDWTRVLDGGWRRGVNTRMTLETHRDEKERVDFLVEHHPGPFADTVASDWQRVHDALLGPERSVTAADLEYRALGEQRAAQVARAAKKARTAFLAANQQRLIDPFPTQDPIEGDLDAIKGKLVVLPELGNRDWISEGGHGYLIAGDGRRGRYIIDSRTPAFEKVLATMYRYRAQVAPKLKERFAVIAAIRGEPDMRVVGSQAVTGLAVDVVAATVGGAMFVDVSAPDSEAPAFAGQEALVSLTVPALPEDANPRQVIEAAIAALQIGDKDAWHGLFAPWDLSRYGNGRVYFNPLYHNASGLDREWLRARRLVLGDVYAMSVVDVGLVHRLTSGDEFPGAPVIDEVDVEVEHVGKFPEGYRPFNNVNVTRVWRLQRLDGGPWRIVTRKGI